MNPAPIEYELLTLEELTRDILVLPDKTGDRPVRGVCLDSRKAGEGDVFLALAGSQQHGLEHLQSAMDAGVSAVLYAPEKGGEALARNWLTSHPACGIPLHPVDNLQQQAGVLASRMYGDPSRQLEVIGITGTNGKTSCSHFLARALAGQLRSAVIGTLGSGRPDNLSSVANTTPDAVHLQQLMEAFVRRGDEAVAMEVSSHALEQYRTAGVCFDGALFTNLSRDHLDYHGTMEAYFAAKLKLFRQPHLRYAAVNLDDPWSERLLAEMTRPASLFGYSRGGAATRASVPVVTASRVRHHHAGLEVTFSTVSDTATATTGLLGDFNVDNLLAVVALLLARGESLAQAVASLGGMQPVAGRMQRVAAGEQQPAVVVDYAHTPDALANAITSLRQHCQGRLWVVFGCGGDRDTGKRPQMGGIARQLADRVIITDDNPRTEDPARIAAQIIDGCAESAVPVELIHDRRQAIATAINSAQASDLILIAGKGHETTQHIGDLRLPFDDRLVAAELLALRHSGGRGS